ncbi:carboxypeptidase PM20D1 [Microbacterium sp. SORGH_AS 505]|uniref:M20/M25/M40 family metallo-hydrolase n=1 Tax=Microbacterium sp. SORGH_AS_0505 TaxID=3041770 RepID=UPI0027810194|nr:M20/M25/M40 family metallo-hydrolase [Microbacterium sp. SORGH_AS_0505]MDQ1127816.1 carboxypeptidase PM20D1 [Microbacterium sp. SORGH_AS_0505]
MARTSDSSLGRFRELLQIPTVSLDPGDADADGTHFLRFHDALVRLYPALHAVLEREAVAGYSLLYRWRGRDAASPLVLMAHIDVVPVVASEWSHEPFGAELVGSGDTAEIHARGAVDDKGSLVAILEAVESLVAEGVVPERDVYLAFGHNEEVAGDGAQAIVEVLRQRGVRPSLVLDEGGAVVEGALPGVTVPTAVIGVAERGVMTVHLTARELGGHASTPPRDPATARLARAVLRLHRRPFPTRLVPPVRAMFETVAPYTSGPLRRVFASIGVTGRLLVKVFPRLGPELNALVRTTAVVTELSGAAGANVLATAARASVNVRLLPGDTATSAEARIRRVVGDPLVEVDVVSASDPSPVSPWSGPAWDRLAAATRSALGEEVLPTPYIQLGASDSRWFTEISGHVYRFTPFHLTRGEREALHSHDERIRVGSWLRGIEFYRDLLRAS